MIRSGASLEDEADVLAVPPGAVVEPVVAAVPDAVEPLVAVPPEAVPWQSYPCRRPRRGR
jgi:hypothetical protein